MSRIDEGLSELLSAFEKAPYPADFLSKYSQLELLSHSHGTETFLVSAKADGMLYVAKCYDKSVFTVVHENDILMRLDHDGLPKYVDSFEDDRLCITVRSYVEGTPLDLYAQQGEFTAAKAVDICVGSAISSVIFIRRRRPSFTVTSSRKTSS
ncbi:MAG: hypothetical protein Q4C01_07355 [Clostridia bacterium]|nr:hypothetical protein [Clostridia bacterium]